ncbi:zinc-binding metallopeptidase family protein [Pseudooceanicola algae]|uniref:Zinc-ribbon domain-containing protein n=1 Tax=Pseudooceanicola algae TaxID=1537215 RepID=A0A418SKZ3_9RHOB|nr:putative zinc-binding metallopeptidase [Pseudooceanicola algae]QPM90973.1 hypothetical protein PSAL_022160 [Pseudooceanicola algae]
MRLYSCACGNRLYFDNTKCTQCGRDVGWCQGCAAITALEPEGGKFRCLGDPLGDGSRHLVTLCQNYATEGVCNRTIPEGGGPFCDCCALNETVPDMSVDGNRERWARLEAAKRRLIYALDRLGLPFGAGTEPPLSFAFMGDPLDDKLWRKAGEEERVYTGHADGLITINIQEADPAEREQIRVDMGEAHRTLIGHFRHEVGHYYWDLLVRGQCETQFKALFGDHENPTYSEALERHYNEGAPANWEESYISAYATMHPWEDWAETWALYLDIASVVDTAEELGLVPRQQIPSVDEMLRRYRALGLVLNELNREMGMLDFATGVINPAVAGKLEFIDLVVRRAAKPGGGGFLDKGPAM